MNSLQVYGRKEGVGGEGSMWTNIASLALPKIGLNLFIDSLFGLACLDI
jgi:hypothetical protein